MAKLNKGLLNLGIARRWLATHLSTGAQLDEGAGEWGISCRESTGPVHGSMKAVVSRTRLGEGVVNRTNPGRGARDSSLKKSRGNGIWLYDSRATGRTNEDAQDLAWLAWATGVCDAGALLEKGTPVPGMNL